MKRTLSIARALTIAFLLSCVSSASRKATRQMASFLLKFGYITEDDSENNRGAYDPNSPEFQASVRKLQRFGNIPVTGRMDVATIKLINTDRCGVKDPQSNSAFGRFMLQGTAWKKRDLTFRIVNYTKDGIPNYIQRRIFRKAFQLWQSASGLRIREVYSRNADILISFVREKHGDDYPFDREGGTLAHAFYPLSNTGLSGDAHFDDDERFTTGTSDGINLDWVAVHEFGHSLGLAHSNVRESIMYPWYKGYHENIELTNDDIQGIQALYPKPTVRPLTQPKVKTTPKTSTTRRPRVTPRSTRRPRVTPRSTRRPRVTPRPLPFLCRSSIRYDTVFVGPNGWTYFFAGQKYWILDRRLRRYGPRTITRYWRRGVKTPVDAAYLNIRRNIVFFKGSEFWEYDSRQRLVNSGSIRQYGLSLVLKNMDAVFTWEGNGKTYFFRGSQYWRYDERTGRADTYRYPRDIQKAWKFPGGVKAAVKWVNGRSYVFWETQYRKLEKGKARTERGYPQYIADRWMKCNTKGRAVGAYTLEP